MKNFDAAVDYVRVGGAVDVRTSYDLKFDKTKGEDDNFRRQQHNNCSREKSLLGTILEFSGGINGKDLFSKQTQTWFAERASLLKFRHK
jgi:hypothetical protein